MDVEFPKHASGRDAALADVARSGDDRVIRCERLLEEVSVHIVEAGTAIANPPFRDERSEKQRHVTVAVCELGLYRAGRARDQHPVAGVDLVEQLPEQHRNTGEIDKTEHRVVRRPRELVALARPQRQRWVRPRVKQHRSA